MFASPMSTYQARIGDSMRSKSLLQTTCHKDNGQLNRNKSLTTIDQEAVFKITWPEFVAGGAGGMTAVLLTSPLNVVRTKLQSGFHRPQLATPSFQNSLVPRQLPFLRLPVFPFHRTFQLFFSIYRVEGWRTLFKGVGPNLLGMVPSTAIKFYIYSNSKRVFSQKVLGGQETALAQLFAAATAAIATSTATNPIWLVKTRLQLDKSVAEKAGRKYKNTFNRIVQIIRQEGIRGLYQGSSASYLGVAEFSLPLVLYEQMKILLTKCSDRNQTSTWHQAVDLGGRIGAAVTSKTLAVMVTYPYGAVRTRLHQAPMNNRQLKYTSIVQCFRLVWKEEGLMSMYRGLSPHLVRILPSTAILFGVFEAVMKSLRDFQ